MHALSWHFGGRLLSCSNTSGKQGLAAVYDNPLKWAKGSIDDSGVSHDT